jgi:cytochrome c-type biogenesis protein
MIDIEIQVSFPLAFAAGVVSFLSPCVLPVVPSYLAFISGLTLEELRDGTTREVRKSALLNSALFMVGFAAVFMTMAFAVTATGAAISAALPWIHRIGGALMIAFGLLLVGVLRVPALARDLRPRLASKPAGALGSLAVGVAFGAGWTPCIGPVLGAVLLYASLETTMVHGSLLLATYALGLGIPFVAASAGLGWFLAVSERVRGWLVPLQTLAGTVLVVIGLTMVTGRFASLTARLAGLGQLINLDLP